MMRRKTDAAQQRQKGAREMVSRTRTTGHVTRRQLLSGVTAMAGTAILAACGGGGGGGQATTAALAQATQQAANKPTLPAAAGATTAATAGGATVAGGATTGAAATAGATSAPAMAPAGAATIQFWTRFDFLKPAIDQYNDQAQKSGKKVFVSVTTIPGAQIIDKLTTALASKTQPDMMSIDLVQCPYFNSLGAFVDTTARFNSLPYKGEFSKSQTSLGNYKGKQYQVPFSADVSALIWNKDIFRDAGLDPEKGPANWDELRQFAQKTTKAPDRFGIAFDAQTGGTFMFRWMPFVWSNGGDILSADGTKSTINTPQALEALQLWVDFVQKDKVTPPGTATFSGDDLRAAFQAGKIAMMVNGNAIVAQVNRDAPNVKYGTSLIPASPKTGMNASFAGGDLVGILAGTKMEEQCWDFVQYLTSDAVQIDYFAKNGVVPVRTGAYKNKYFDAEPKYQVFPKALDVARTPFTLKYNRLYDSLQANLQSALAGQKSAQQALTEIEAAHNKLLSE